MKMVMPEHQLGLNRQEYTLDFSMANKYTSLQTARVQPFGRFTLIQESLRTLLEQTMT